jgi:hypothetical protein
MRYHSPNPVTGAGLMIIVVITFFGSVSTIFAQSAKPVSSSADQVAKADLIYKVIELEGGGYGYDIYADKKLLIHQTVIPGQPGVTGFRKRSDSGKVAELVIKKLKNKEMPPAITTEELRQLKVID